VKCNSGNEENPKFPIKFMTKTIVIVLILTAVSSFADSQSPAIGLKSERMSLPCERGGVQLSGEGRPSKSHESKPALPPLPVGVTELKFGDFFVNPIGTRGLTFTEKLRNLDGHRVRIVGYMVRREPATPGTFLFAPAPAQLDEDHYGLADDLPVSTMHVFMPKDRQEVVEYKRGLLQLIGSLSVGPKEEPDGRISTVRLAVELPKPPRVTTRPAASAKGAQRMMR
jgi:hypothetical protein